MIKKISKILLAVLLVISFVSTSVSAKSVDQRGAWMWDATIIHTDVIDRMKQLNINNAIVNVGWQPSAKQHYLASNPRDYKVFIRKAHRKGMTVEALYGNSDWSKTSHLASLEKEVKVVLEFNKNSKHKFDAIHLDIEPHTLSNWSGNEEQLLTEYLSNLKVVRGLVDEHNKRTNDNIQLVVDIPNWIYQYNANGQPFLPQLFELIDEVSVMNYTQNMDWYLKAGTIFLEHGDNYGVKVSIGSEFQAGYGTTSLYGLSKEDTEQFLNKGLETFKNYNSFKQLQVHTFEAYENHMK